MKTPDNGMKVPGRHLLPKIDLEELKRLKEENFRERLEFIDLYVEWLKKTPNKKWSSQQKKIIG